MVFHRRHLVETQGMAVNAKGGAPTSLQVPDLRALRCTSVHAGALDAR